MKTKRPKVKLKAHPRRCAPVSGSAASCGCRPASDLILRKLNGVAWPTTFIQARCMVCGREWTERYEFDFAIPKPQNKPLPGAQCSARLLEAARNADWEQVVFNGGPPCFHLEDKRFCLRAERWDGHKNIGGSDSIHEYVSLENLLSTRPRA